MKRFSYVVVFWAWTNLLFGTHAVTAYAQETAQETAEQAVPESYTAVCDAFMAGETENIRDLVMQAMREARHLTREQRATLTEIRRASPNMPPRWWDRTKSSSNVSFKADMWGRGFEANYIPSDILGMQAAVGVRHNRLVVVVTWRPASVDNPKPLEGWLAAEHGLTEGDLGEVIVWHELGHNYISLNLNVRQAMELYTEHQILFSHVQEFYADLTALRHASPKAARTTLMFRLREMHDYNERDAHTRGAHGIASLLLAEWLANPDAWPMVHFPPEVPRTNTERETIKYIYENFDPEWTPQEYFALQSFIDNWVKRNGDRVLRGRGRVQLPNDLDMMLTEPDDREHQPKRDEWVAKRLAKIIEDGRADKEAPKREDRTDAFGRWSGIQIPW